MSTRILLGAVCLTFAAGESRALPPVGQRLREAKVEKARANVEARRDRAAWAERMLKKGYMTPGQAQVERAKLAEAEAALLRAQAELKALRPEGGFFAELVRHVLRVRAAEAQVEAAREQLDVARERAAWSERMVKKGFMSPVQAQAEQARATEAADRLRQATEEVDALRPRPEKK
jgi:outer membrane protein TolC